MLPRFADLRVTQGRFFRAYGEVDSLIAKATQRGTLELLCPAWHRVLGYRPGELDGRSFSRLIAADAGGAASVIAALLEPRTREPIRFSLRCKGGGHMPFVWFRQYDAYDESLYLFGDRPPAKRAETAPLRAGAIAG
jgi:hypothetical protein